MTGHQVMFFFFAFTIGGGVIGYMLGKADGYQQGLADEYQASIER